MWSLQRTMRAAAQRQLFPLPIWDAPAERPFRKTAVCGAKVRGAEPAAIDALHPLSHPRELAPGSSREPVYEGGLENFLSSMNTFCWTSSNWIVELFPG